MQMHKMDSDVSSIITFLTSQQNRRHAIPPFLSRAELSLSSSAQNSDPRVSFPFPLLSQKLSPTKTFSILYILPLRFPHFTSIINFYIPGKSNSSGPATSINSWPKPNQAKKTSIPTLSKAPTKLFDVCTLSLSLSLSLLVESPSFLFCL